MQVEEEPVVESVQELLNEPVLLVVNVSVPAGVIAIP